MASGVCVAKRSVRSKSTVGRVGVYVGLARTVIIRCMHGIFGREISNSALGDRMLSKVAQAKMRLLRQSKGSSGKIKVPRARSRLLKQK